MNVLIISLICCVISAASKVVDFLTSNFDMLVTYSGEKAFVKFVSPDCGEKCKSLKRTWDKLGRTYDDSNLILGNVDCGKEPSLCEAQDVKEFPTLKYYTSEYSEGVTYLR